MSELIIRRAELNDAATIQAFNKAIAWETEQKQLDDNVLSLGVRAVFSDSAKGFYTVAERAGELVGQALITYEFSDWRNGWYWWVQSVYVRTDARRSGVFRALFEHLKREATADASVIGLRLYVERENQRAQETYAALGMEEEQYHLFGLYPLPGRTSAY